MEAYLEKGRGDPRGAARAARAGACARGISSRWCSSRRRPGGIAELMDIIVQLLPNPLEGTRRVYVKTAADGKTSELGAEPDPKQHASPTSSRSRSTPT